MSYLGFDAVGRFALGQLSGITGVNVSGAAGTGTAGVIDKALAKGVAQAAGTGAAGVVTAQTGTFVVFIGAAGIGTAGAIRDTLAIPFSGTAGIGQAGAVGYGQPSLSRGFPGAASIGRAGTIVAGISGGGTSAATSASGPRDKRRKTGLEPVAKRYEPPTPIEQSKLPLPPFRDAPLAPLTAPDELRELVPLGLLSLQDQIFHAQDSFDIAKFLGGIDHDEQDAADIADVLALLDD